MVFSRYKLLTFLACRRRFQLRYLVQQPWPDAPQGDEWRLASERGLAFHKLLERHFLGLPPLPAEMGAGEDRALRQWWQRFQEQGPVVPAGQRLPELTLMVPVGSHLLTGRFDLLVLTGDGAAHIFDWKTERRPRSLAELAGDWQTRLYLALLAEGGEALLPGRGLDPAQIRLTYWFVHDPAGGVTIGYNATEHAASWAGIRALVAQIDGQLAETAAWPLTDDWGVCGRCAYQVLCGRLGVPAGEPDEVEEAWEALADEDAGAWPMLPQLP